MPVRQYPCGAITKYGVDRLENIGDSVEIAKEGYVSIDGVRQSLRIYERRTNKKLEAKKLPNGSVGIWRLK